jgi:uncharacterized protein
VHRCPYATDTSQVSPAYTIRVTVISDPQGATFSASKFLPETKDLGG